MRESGWEACLRCQRQDLLSLDHIFPMWAEGENISNPLQILCIECHREKNLYEHWLWLKPLSITTKRALLLKLWDYTYENLKGVI